MCTGIKIDYKDACVLGRTMDYEVPLKYNGLYLPRAYEYGEDLDKNPLISRHRALGICFENRNPLKDGVNEHGLVGITNAFAGFNLYSKDPVKGKKNLSSMDYFNYALMTYRSVEELIDDLDNINLASRNILGQDVLSPDFHYMFADRTKRAIVVEPKGGRLSYYENPYNVMTNSPKFSSHVKRLKKTIDLEDLRAFNSVKDLPGSYDPVSRFIRAYYFLGTTEEANSQEEALGYAYNILGAMAMPKGFVTNEKYQYITYTRYICVYDSGKNLMTFKSYMDPSVYEISIDDIEDKAKRKEFYIENKYKGIRL